jgi:DNA-binding MarR family transcriptional regulator
MSTRVAKEQQFTEIVLEIFRLNGRLIAAGDALVGPIGLTSARWQVLGAIVLLGGPAPVVRIADAMGLSRQAVQRVVDDMVQGGALAFEDNPHHKRAKLVALTTEGRSLYGAATRLQRTWAAALVSGLDAATLQSTAKALAQLRARLETSLN